MEDIQTQMRIAADYTVACICPMGIELAAVEAMLDRIHPSLHITHGENAYTLGQIGQHNVVVAVLPETGNNKAAIVATQLVSDFPAIRFALLVGIGGGVPKNEDENEAEDEEADGDGDIENDIRLGDVVVGLPKDTFGAVVQYDLGKKLSDGTLCRTGYLGKPPPMLIAHVRRLQAQHERVESQIPAYLSQMVQKWPKMKSNYTKPDSKTAPDQLFRASYSHQAGKDCKSCDIRQVRRRPKRPNEEPQIHYGTIGSANVVVKDAILREKLKKDANLLCVEMEAAGFMDVFPGLVIRGICDYADSHKNKKWQSFAAAMAAAYMKELLMVIPTEAVIQTAKAADALMLGEKTHEKLDELLQFETLKLERMQHESQKQALRELSQEEEQCHRLFRTTDYEGQKNRNPIRLKGTCQWALQHALFQRWQQSESGDLLWISADPGCGKSVLARSLVDSDLKASNKSATICYFFFKDIVEQDDLSTALCALLHQLFEQQPFLLHHATKIHKLSGDRIQREAWTLWRILQAALTDSSAQPTICVLDALDECRDNDRAQLVSWLCDLFRQNSSSIFKFLVTARPLDNVQRWFVGSALNSPLKEMLHIRLHGENMNDQIQQEITLVVDHTIDLLAHEFLLSDDKCAKLRQSLNQMQHRTYLWLYLSIEAIRDAIILDPDELEVDKILPKSVEDAYEKMLQKVKSAHKLVSRRVLLIVLGARRALSITEMAAALNTCQYLVGSKSFQTDPYHLERHIRDWCGLFIFINHSKLYLIHQTAKAFLVASETGPELSRVTEPDCWKSSFTQIGVEDEMARICVENVYRVIEMAPKDTIDQFFEYSARQWPWHYRDNAKSDGLDFLDRVLLLYNTKGKFFSLWFPIMWKAHHPYATDPVWSDQHLAAYFGHTNLLRGSLRKPDADCDVCDGDHRTALYWASTNGHTDAVQLLCAYHANVNAKSHKGWAALHSASNNGHLEVVRLLLDHHANIDDRNKEGQTALYLASTNGHVAVVHLLLRYHADVSTQADTGQTALQRASVNGHNEVVRLLLEHHAKIDAQAKDGQTALHLASISGHIEVVRILLEHHANVDAQEKSGYTALYYASRYGYIEVVQLLIKHHADVNIRGCYDWNALQMASVHGYTKIVQFLLEHHAEIDFQDTLGRTALYGAARSGYIEVVQLLLEHHADIDARDKKGVPPLHAASAGNHAKVVQLLIKCQAKHVDARDEYGQTALLCASQQGHIAVVRLLLGYGANPDVQDPFPRTALFWASREGNTEIVRLLLEHHANVDAQASDGRTALCECAARKQGHIEIVQLLLDYHANINIQDKDGQTALYLASTRGHVDITQLLLKYQADVNIQDRFGQTALHSASKNGHTEMVKLLLDHHADVDTQEEDKETALHMASARGHFEVVQLLLANQAKVDVRDSDNWTALHYASYDGHVKIVQLLLDMQADPNIKDSAFGYTPLEIAADKNHPNVVQLLRDRTTSMPESKGNENKIIQ